MKILIRKIKLQLKIANQKLKKLQHKLKINKHLKRSYKKP